MSRCRAATRSSSSRRSSKPSGHLHAGLPQDAAPRRFRAERLELRIGGVERDVEEGGQAPLERAGAEHGQVGAREVGDGGPYLLEEPRPLEDLLREGARRGVVDGEEGQPRGGVAGGDAGQEVEVVVHDERRDRLRGDVHDPRLGIAQAHEQEEERLLVEAGGPEAGEVPVVHGHRGHDHRRVGLVVLREDVGPQLREARLERFERLRLLLGGQAPPDLRARLHGDAVGPLSCTMAATRPQARSHAPRAGRPAASAAGACAGRAPDAAIARRRAERLAAEREHRPRRGRRHEERFVLVRRPAVDRMAARSRMSAPPVRLPSPAPAATSRWARCPSRCASRPGDWSARSPPASGPTSISPRAETALLVAVPVLLGSLARLPAGMLADRFGARPVFTILMVAERDAPPSSSRWLRATARCWPSRSRWASRDRRSRSAWGTSRDGRRRHDRARPSACTGSATSASRRRSSSGRSLAAIVGWQAVFRGVSVALLAWAVVFALWPATRRAGRRRRASATWWRC